MTGGKSLDMTQGPIFGQLIRFSVPLLIGNIFQQLYSTVDGIVVGNYVGKTAIAAIGSTTSIINTLIGLFIGFSVGGGVVISQYFGAKDEDNLSRSVHTSLLMSALFGIFVMVVGILLTDPLLRLMATPGDVFPNSHTYLTIYFSGALALLVYNMASGILRAVGDSRWPLYSLGISSLLNVGLDLLFVCVFEMGIAGAAWATVISQFVSAAVLLVVLAKRDEAYGLRIKKLRITPGILRLMIKVGIPVGLQNAVISFSNVFVQSYINYFQSSVMAAWTAVFRVHQVLILPQQSLGMAATSFVGQNYGAQNEKRAAQGVRVCLLSALAITVVLSAAMMLFRTPLVRLFNKEADVVYYGAAFSLMFAPFHLCICFEQVLAGAIRGAGDSKRPMLIILLCYAALRQVYLFIASRLTENVFVIVASYPFCWLVCMVTMIICYRAGKWKKFLLKS